MTTAQQFAITSATLSIEAVAVYSLRTYDVWGNSEDGFEVNNVFDQGTIDVPFHPTIHNIAAHPGASDQFRTFPATPSHTLNDLQFINWYPSEDELTEALQSGSVDWSGDDMVAYAEDPDTGEPLCELHLIGWRDADDELIPIDNS
jgi:hypothetical protein